MVNAAPLPWLEAPLAQALAQRGHALLIHGPAGVGQFELGLACAKALLCEGSGPRPCGGCAACRLVDQRTHPDFRLVLPAALRIAMGEAGAEEEGGKKTKPSREIQVAAVREAIGWSQQTPSRGGTKVLLICPAQAMNVVTANALLKTLEEPPASLRLILCATDPDLLLPTLRSRCQKLQLGIPASAMALGWLAQRGVADAQTLLDAAGGRPLDAMALVDEGLDAAAWRRFPQAMARGDASAVAGLAPPRLVDSLQKLCHDAMVLSVGGTPRFFPADVMPPVVPLAALAAWSKELTRIARNDEHPWQAPLLVDTLVLQAQRTFAPREPGQARRFDTLAAS